MSGVTNGIFIEENEVSEAVISKILGLAGINYDLMKVDTRNHIPGCEFYSDRLVLTLTTAAKDNQSNYVYFDYEPGGFPCFGQLLDSIYGMGRYAEYRIIVTPTTDQNFIDMVTKCNDCGLPIYMIKKYYKDGETLYRIIESPTTPSRDLSQLPTRRSIEMLYFWHYCFRPEKVVFGSRDEEFGSICAPFENGIFQVEWNESGLWFNITTDSQSNLINHLWNKKDDFISKAEILEMYPEIEASLIKQNGIPIGITAVQNN